MECSAAQVNSSQVWYTDDTPIVEDAVSPPPIPPRVSRKATPEKTAHTDEKDSPTRSSVNVIDLLTTRQEEYKKAAINAKKNGDIETALKYVKIVKVIRV